MINVILMVIIALFFTAIFSGMEIAFTTFNRFKLEIDRSQNRLFSRIIDYFFEHTGQYIITIMIGKYISLIIYALSLTELIDIIIRDHRLSYIFQPLGVHIILATLILIFTAELLSKIVVKFNPSLYLHIFSIPTFTIYILLYPITKIITWISYSILWVFGFGGQKMLNLKGFDREDLEHLLEEVIESDDNDNSDDNIKLFHNTFEFSDLKVRDCMIPRVDIEAVEINTSIKYLLDRFIETHYSRIFIFEKTIDNIIGYVSTKGLFTMPESISDILMKVDFVPESLPTQRLLSNLIRTNKSVAVVVDEFGGTAGMISMEDVLEEIFGEIEDEYDSNDDIERKLSENEYLLSCRLEVEYLNEKYNFNIPESDDYDTLAGYIISNNERIPNKGEELFIDNKIIKILRTSASKLDLVQLKII